MELTLFNIAPMKNQQYWVEKLNLQPHPEGGFFKEVYRSEGTIPATALPNNFGGSRNFATSIYFMLTAGNFSAFHRIKSDETWHFYTGESITVSVIHNDGKLEEIHLGDNPDNGEVFQATVPANAWFASALRKDEGYSLVGCTVAPGFDFQDFEMADRERLSAEFPQHQSVIQKLTRI